MPQNLELNQLEITLNPSQEKAVNFKDGQLLVVAGAGTGKTRVITQRVKRLVKEEKLSPKNILALTFTEKAAGEMLARLDKVMPLGYEEPWVYTFHTFADRILSREALEIGLDNSYKILSGPQQWLLFRKNLFNFDLEYFRPLGNPTKFISAILKFISRLQDEYISPEELKEFAQSYSHGTDAQKEEKRRWMELAHVYEKYQQIKIEQSKLDFGDLITWTIRLFEERSSILKKYQDQFKHVLLDEFQDTNYSQYKLVKLLCPQQMPERSLLAVGDDSQSIYKFRGAAISNILDFMNDYPEAQMVTLTQNYRSTQHVLDPAYKLIQNNNPDTLETKLGISKKLESKKEEDAKAKSPKPQAIILEDWEDEVEFVMKKIMELLAQEPEYTFKDVAIMARANSHLDPFVLALRKYGLPYQLVGNRGLYDTEEVRDVISLLRVTINPKDSISLYRVLNIDSLEVPSQHISNLLSTSKYKKTDIWELMEKYEVPQVKKLVELVKKYQDRITKDTPSDFIYKFVNELNYLAPLLKEETVENQLKIKNLDIFLDEVKSFEIAWRQDTKEIPTIVDFLDQLELLIEAGDNPAQAEIEDIDTINLLTVHASKGLEFPVVFMVNLVAGRFPTRNRKDIIDLPDELIKETLPSGDAHIQEERRLFYVGMTRAEKYLYLTMAKDYGGKREKKMSGYIEESGVPHVEVSSQDLKSSTQQTGLFGVESGFKDPLARKVAKGFVPEFLSYSQIDTYRRCPLQYKYKYILNIPMPPNHALSYGITIHDTLRYFHTALQYEPHVSLDDFLKMYQNNWQPLGYLDEAHRKVRFEEGKKLLEAYYTKHANEKPNHFALEKSFNVRIGGVRFYGKIDRIDNLDDGTVEIIDYKTGSTKEQKEVDKDDQVAYYSLGVQQALGLKPKKLTYYFVESGEKVSTSRTSEQLAEKEEEVKEIVEKMGKGEFEANPGFHCSFCDYREICPFALKF